MLRIILALAIAFWCPHQLPAQSLPGWSGGIFDAFASVAPIGTPTSLGSGASSPSGTTISFTTSSALDAGKLAVIVVGWNSTNIVTSSSLSDGTNTYTKAIEFPNASAANSAVAIWYKENAAAVSSGATITVTMSGTLGATNAGMAGAQVSGVLASSSLDKTASGTSSSSTTCTATTATLSQANEVLFGGVIGLGGPTGYTGATGFTNLALPNVSAVYIAQDYQKVSATTAVSFVPVWNASSVRNACVVASFKGN